MTQEQANQLDVIASYIGSPLTDEQKEFASDFTRDTISFSDPGTGKTHTLVAGLLMAQKYHKVEGRQIDCMSFTKAATSEMAGRYEKLCKKCSIAPTVVFNTFHSLSNRIMKEAYPNMKIIANSNVKQDVEDMTHYLSEVGIETEDTRFVRKVLAAVNTLNSALIFHPDNVELNYSFVELGMELETFQMLRKKWFMRGIILNTIVQGDIPLYCLYALMKKQHIIDNWKGKYKIMIVDEFQDLSLLHLHILSYITDRLVVIGDMKQQIYAFNGACPQIVEEYLRLHPTAVECNLTRSFRCGQEIADFASKIIEPNNPPANDFKGHNRGSNVQIMHRRDLNWKEIAETIEADQKVHGYGGARNIMFLYRNNASAIPIIDELYKRGIPYRCSKYQPIMSVPMFESLSKLVNAAWQPRDTRMASDAFKLFPEFKNTPWGMEPFPVQAMIKSGKSIFEVPYKYREKSSQIILQAMSVAAQAIADGKSAGAVYMKVMEVYKKFILPNEWWKLDNTEEFYFNLVAPICNNKTYPIMYNEELDKISRNQDCINAGMGIRCYTMHSAKGLEADDVYILDCDEGIFPNAKILKNKEKAGCLYDIAKDIRSERNLLYVAITRAKYNVYITYSGAQPALLLTDPMSSEYHRFDKVYEETKKDYDDAAEFFKLFNLTENQEEQGIPTDGGL